MEGRTLQGLFVLSLLALHRYKSPVDHVWQQPIQLSEFVPVVHTLVYTHATCKIQLAKPTTKTRLHIFHSLALRWVVASH